MSIVVIAPAILAATTGCFIAITAAIVAKANQPKPIPIRIRVRDRR